MARRCVVSDHKRELVVRHDRDLAYSLGKSPQQIELSEHERDLFTGSIARDLSISVEEVSALDETMSTVQSMEELARTIPAGKVPDLPDWAGWVK